MTQAGTFAHVSPAQYARDSAPWPRPLPLAAVPLPRRATQGAAGYDFVCPVDCALAPGETACIPTGIRAVLAPGWVLLLFPRSSLGVKKGLVLCNTVGVVDGDYAQADNEGHILVYVRNLGAQPLALARGERFCQGVLLPFGLAGEEAETAPRRTGGFGSTGL